MKPAQRCSHRALFFGLLGPVGLPLLQYPGCVASSALSSPSMGRLQNVVNDALIVVELSPTASSAAV
jgi:hypothetical protein